MILTDIVQILYLSCQLVLENFVSTVEMLLSVAAIWLKILQWILSPVFYASIYLFVLCILAFWFTL